jgi:hypothetical protein
LLNTPANPSANAAPIPVAEGGAFDQAHRVLQWQPDWVQYDEFYKLLIFNPYREPLQVVYLYAGAGPDIDDPTQVEPRPTTGIPSTPSPGTPGCASAPH